MEVEARELQELNEAVTERRDRAMRDVCHSENEQVESRAERLQIAALTNTFL